MADERDDQFGSDPNDAQQTTGQESPQNEFGEQDHQTLSDQRSEGSFGGQNGGQPIGGNDSSTGSGTTLTQGADIGGQSSSGQTQPSEGSGDTLTANQQHASGLDQDGDSSAGASLGGTEQGSGGEGFIGSQAQQSGDYLEQRDPDAQATDEASGSGTSSASSAQATGGSDFAKGGRGVLDEDDEGSSSASDFGSGPSSGGDAGPA